ncbi:hypothetical protein TNIN_489041 [Trichonephila inaurata madagascariensis]|uniref:Uncharacterized protein n=1 Tax=Trichonephila inaurata madagascariensis TaxID=2747483 RepID=A0A8X6YYC4_9ARAC|nr:hypothetical protein TNIN_489041 [Trichonephila inaurata madagascariensis]
MSVCFCSGLLDGELVVHHVATVSKATKSYAPVITIPPSTVTTPNKIWDPLSLAPVNSTWCQDPPPCLQPPYIRRAVISGVPTPGKSLLFLIISGGFGL